MSTNPFTQYKRIYGSTAAARILDLLILLPQLSYKDRKCLMTVARARCFPRPHTTLYRMARPTIHRLSLVSNTFVEQLKLALSTPMLSGFLLSALLSAPYEIREVNTIKKMLMWKEVSVMESIPRKPTIRWDNIFSAWESLHFDFRYSKSYNQLMRRSLKRWISKCTSKIIYPAMGTKAVSFKSRQDLEYCLGRDIDSETEVTSASLEHFYSRTGIQVKGECEMKQKWYPTQASPRTYYAQGGEAYHTSKHLRDCFNWLCDSFSSTQRFNRVSPSGMAVDQNTDDVYVYDLTSFTSLYHEHRSFLQFLAVVTDEVKVRIFDSWEGPLEVSLGSMIYTYLESNVFQPSYSTRIPQLSDLELVHSVAGFLGVFGNLATCTFPHGLCLGTVRGSDQESWCAGDDAGTIDSKETEGRDTFLQAEAQGVLERSKTFRVSEEGSLALKRPVLLTGNCLYQRANILWPIFSVMCDSDPRYNLLPVSQPWERVTGSIVAFLRTCERCPMSSGDIEFAYTFFEEFYRKNNLPMSGWYPPLTGYWPFRQTIPRIERSVFGRDPLTVLVESFYGTEYVSARIEDIPWEGNSTLVRNSVFSCNSHEHLTYLMKLGYLDRQLEMCIYEGREGFNKALIDATQPQKKFYVYTFTVIESIPSSLWLL
jgi:hypothetical protein